MHPKTLSYTEIWLSNGERTMSDGVHFINVYSNGITQLGRTLSNFAFTPFTYRGERYNSVEGYWYSKTTGKPFGHLYGYKAKKLGRAEPQMYPVPTARQLYSVYKAKLKANPGIVAMLLANKLPFTHYYEFKGVPISAGRYLWTADLWRKLTDELRNEKSTSNKTKPRQKVKRR